MSLYRDTLLLDTKIMALTTSDESLEKYSGFGAQTVYVGCITISGLKD